jgi:endonuclease/exonuclease/phosphatase family metal-dependent hydrolase
MYKKLLIALAIASALDAGAATHRFATFNIRYANSDLDTDGKEWKVRGPYCRDLIINYDLDVVGFQEPAGTGRVYRNPDTTLSQIDDLKAWLSDYEIVAWDRDGTRKWEYVATAYKKARYELLDQGHFFISPTPDSFSYGWDTSIEKYPRVLGWLKLKDKTSGETFIYATTHTNDGWSLDGPYGSELIATRLKDIAGDLPVMLVADFNTNRALNHTRKGLKAYRASFHDAALEVPADKNYSLPVTNPAVTWTYNAFNPASKTGYTGTEIDYQYYRGMNILERHIVTEQFTYNGTAYPVSDHFPIFVVAELTSATPKSLYVDCNASEGGNGTVVAPYRTISDAVAASDIDDTIFVAAGTYNESVQPPYTVSILGGYIDNFTKTGGTSVLDGTGLTTPPIYASELISLNLKDFTVRNYKSTDSSRDGAILFRGADLNMENVVVENNSATDYGGGLAIYNITATAYCESNNVTLHNCTFRNNSAAYGGAMALGFYKSLDIDGCTFADNTATMSGGAVYLTYGTPESARIWFTEATGLITNSSFINNTSARSGAFYASEEMPNVKLNIVNTTFAGNTIDAKGGLASVVKGYGGTAIHAKLVDRPTDAALSKVTNAALNLGHVTMIGNHATCAAPANFLASALTVSNGSLMLLNNIIAGNSSNGTNAYADITVSSADILASEKRNIFTAPATINFTADATSHSADTAEAGVKAIADMEAGSLDADGKYIAAITTIADEPTPFVALKSTEFNGTNVQTLSTLTRKLETNFGIDIDRDGSTNALIGDQLGHERNASTMPGAVEFYEKYSAIDDITADGSVNGVNITLLPGGQLHLSADKALGRVTAIDIAGRTVATANIADTEGSLDLSTTGSGIFIVTCQNTSFKVLK